MAAPATVKKSQLSKGQLKKLKAKEKKEQEESAEPAGAASQNGQAAPAEREPAEPAEPANGVKEQQQRSNGADHNMYDDADDDVRSRWPFWKDRKKAEIWRKSGQAVDVGPARGRRYASRVQGHLSEV